MRQTMSGPVSVDAMARGLDTPWGLAFLPGERSWLPSETARFFTSIPRAGRPKSRASRKSMRGGRAGLWTSPPRGIFQITREIFLTFSKPHRRGGGTALAVAALSSDNRKLENLRVIFEMASPSSRRPAFRLAGRGGAGTGHYISRSARGETAIRRRTSPSTTARLSASGATGASPRTIRFVGRAGARPEIWSWGHRNPQGAALDASGSALGRRARRAGRRRDKPGEEGPELRVAGHLLRPPLFGRKNRRGRREKGHGAARFLLGPFHRALGNGDLFGAAVAGMARAFFVGSLKFDHISRLDPAGGFREVERLAFPETGRVRDVREAPDGTLWFLSEERGAVYRIKPAR